MAAEGEHGQGDECFGLRNPKAMRASRRILVLVDSLDQSLGQALFEGGVDHGAVFDDVFLQGDEDRDAAGPS